MIRKHNRVVYAGTIYEMVKFETGDVIPPGSMGVGASTGSLPGSPGIHHFTKDIPEKDRGIAAAWAILGGYHAWVPVSLLDLDTKTTNEFGEVSP